MIKFLFPLFLAILIGLVFVLSKISHYEIHQDESGVIYRFGQYSKTVSPGIHFRIPFVDTFKGIYLFAKKNKNLPYTFYLPVKPKNILGQELLQRI